MPPAVISPGTIAMLATILVMGANALGLVVPSDQANAIISWCVNGVGVAAAIIAIYRHWREKANVKTLSNQVQAAGGVPAVGPSAGQIPTQAAQAKARSALAPAVAILLLAGALGLAACATPAGAPPQSPRETADPVLIGYGAVLLAADTAVESGQLSPSVKSAVQASTHFTTGQVLAYAHQAHLCFRDPTTGAVGDAPSNPAGAHCDPSALNIAVSQATQAVAGSTALLTGFGITVPETH